jgi:maleamate amidohydrolase
MEQASELDENYRGVWGNRIGFGKSPALLIVDFMKGYTTPGRPLFAPDAVKAVHEAEELLGIVRDLGFPVIHTNIRYHSNLSDGGTWVRKAPVMRTMLDGHPDADFCEEVRPQDHEVVVTKQYASAFFGTSLASMLHAAGIDTVVIMGCSTSGCVRATAVDATQNGFRTIVVRECVGDRHRAPHDASLFDIDAKYGDVVDKGDVIDCLRKLSKH